MRSTGMKSKYKRNEIIVKCNDIDLYNLSTFRFTNDAIGSACMKCTWMFSVTGSSHSTVIHGWISETKDWTKNKIKLRHSSRKLQANAWWKGGATKECVLNGNDWFKHQQHSRHCPVYDERYDSTSVISLFPSLSLFPHLPFSTLFNFPSFISSLLKSSVLSHTYQFFLNCPC